jgi:hypothetical protein
MKPQNLVIVVGLLALPDLFFKEVGPDPTCV